MEQLSSQWCINARRWRPTHSKRVASSRTLQDTSMSRLVGRSDDDGWSTGCDSNSWTSDTTVVCIAASSEWRSGTRQRVNGLSEAGEACEVEGRARAATAGARRTLGRTGVVGIRAGASAGASSMVDGPESSSTTTSSWHRTCERLILTDNSHTKWSGVLLVLALELWISWMAALFTLFRQLSNLVHPLKYASHRYDKERKSSLEIYFDKWGRATVGLTEWVYHDQIITITIQNHQWWSSARVQPTHQTHWYHQQYSRP